MLNLSDQYLTFVFVPNYDLDFTYYFCHVHAKLAVMYFIALDAVIFFICCGY